MCHILSSWNISAAIVMLVNCKIKWTNQNLVISFCVKCLISIRSVYIKALISYHVYV
jgi:hypothetical protein